MRIISEKRWDELEKQIRKDQHEKSFKMGKEASDMERIIKEFENEEKQELEKPSL